MQVHINRGSERYGPFSIEEVNGYLADGTLQPMDQAWQDGMPDWVPISQIPNVIMPADKPSPPLSSVHKKPTCPWCEIPVEPNQTTCTDCGADLKPEGNAEDEMRQLCVHCGTLVTYTTSEAGDIVHGSSCEKPISLRVKKKISSDKSQDGTYLLKPDIVEENTPDPETKLKRSCIYCGTFFTYAADEASNGLNCPSCGKPVVLFEQGKEASERRLEAEEELKTEAGHNAASMYRRALKSEGAGVTKGVIYIIVGSGVTAIALGGLAGVAEAERRILGMDWAKILFALASGCIGQGIRLIVQQHRKRRG
jgi:predicted  nucleic acid-binding Zn-ribbon protein